MNKLPRNFMLCFVPFFMFWFAVYPENGSPPFLTFKQVLVVTFLAALVVTIFFYVVCRTLGIQQGSDKFVPYQGPSLGDHRPDISRPDPTHTPTSHQPPPGCLPVEPRHGD